MVLLGAAVGGFLLAHGPLRAQVSTGTAPEKVVAYYFHATIRCVTCRTIERYSREAIEQAFPRELKDGRLEWKLVNMQLPENRHFIREYQLFTRSLVIAKVHAGKQVERRNLEKLLGSASAIWLGILTSISPCPLATNIAAMSFIGKEVGSPVRVLLTGTVYTAGRTLAYTALAALLLASVFAIPETSFLLEMYMNKALGLLLIVVGIVLPDVLPIAFSASCVTGTLETSLRSRGLAGATRMPPAGPELESRL